MSTKRIFASLLATLALLAGIVLPASATDPVTIPPGQFVVDQSDVLTDAEENQLEQQVRELQSEAGGTLFVIFVPSFTNPSSPDGWTNAVAEQKQLGTNDNILAVATEDRQYNFVTHSGGSFRPYQETINRQFVLPALSDSDWVGAAEGAIEGLGMAAAGQLNGQGGADGTTQAPAPTGGGSLIWFFLLPIGAALLGFLVMRNRKKQPAAVGQRGAGAPQQPQDPRDAMSVEELRTQAGSALIQADEAIKVAEQEIGFAQASYGDSSVEVFQKDLVEAKQHMQASFKLQHQLDDHIPDTEEDQRSWLKEILDRSAEVMTSLQEHESDFAKLRDLERNAAPALERVKTVFAPLAQEHERAASTLSQLGAEYDERALAEGRDNLQQAQGLLSFAQEKITAAASALNSNDRSQAAWHIHEAENTTQELQDIYASIQQLPDDLDKARRQLNVELSQSRQLLSEAKTFRQQSRVDPALPGLIAELEHSIAKVSAVEPSRSPVQDLEELDGLLDPVEDALQPMRDQHQQLERARRDFDPTMAKARSAIDTADDYIRRRRGAVQHQARTKLSAAQEHFNQALNLAHRDPVAGLGEAQRALQLARTAQRIAEDDYRDFDHHYRGRGGRGGSDMNAILGGLLLGQLLGGGRSSSGGGGMFGGGSSGGGGGGFFGGSGGGFGGGFGGGGGFSGGSGGSF